MLEVTTDDVMAHMQTPFDDEDLPWVGRQIDSAYRKIRVAFARRGRDFDRELVTVPWLSDAAFDVVLEMVTGAIVVGPNAGVRSLSSTTGPQSDSITYADPGRIAFSGVKLMDDMLAQLGLLHGAPLGAFPPPTRWPEPTERPEVRRGRADRCDW